ncbi:hypothetical protein [Saccharopolyspora mangrovi]|uniref:Uncharacterized protein n=1 Tax=Saccharopolyspora mangrovi TaxID=3082379 RepID=A0ABU6ADV9_9PSEU|nr:hypothetical protein [Saccharopolyspora sp. S2-29]MEB3369715.1 hypothetical protein [Saccharopolyspora sp. S2-29]
MSVEVLREVLREVLIRALDNLREQAGERVELNDDLFWSVPPELTYDVYAQPQPDQLTVGQLSDCWSNLVRLNQPGGEIPPYALVWLADVLRVLGRQAR